MIKRTVGILFALAALAIIVLTAMRQEPYTSLLLEPEATVSTPDANPVRKTERIPTDSLPAAPDQPEAQQSAPEQPL